MNPNIQRQRWLLDSEWRFHEGDIPMHVPQGQGETYMWVKTGYEQGVPNPVYDDTSWRVVDLPHDWAVEAPVDKNNNIANGFRPKGVAWYRRRFKLENEDPSLCYYLEFEGIFRNSTVWLNGHRLGNEPSGYTTFRYDVSDMINRGGINTIVVRVDATDFEGWWYEGSGIYRHVWLEAVPNLHIAPWGIFVSPSFPRSSDLSKSIVKIQTKILNKSFRKNTVQLVSIIYNANGKEVGKISTRIKIQNDQECINQQIPVSNPSLWSVDSPVLYTLRTELWIEEKCIDIVNNTFGFRHIYFDPEKGFFLNNKHLTIQGTCNHQDHAGVGIAVPDALHEYRIRQLKAMGCNAYRCAHNPPAPAFLDACDRLGMLVMDETRKMEATSDGLRQLEAMILRDRNHPSVILWSMGNEEPLQDTIIGARIVRSMINHARKLDNTRPFTFAMSGTSWGNEFTKELDVQGCNYGIVNLDKFHKENPKKPVFMSENSASVFTRGIYETDIKKGYVSAYDVNSPPWWNTTTETAWKTIAEREYMAGSFTWTGFDYKGEPQPLEWPCINSHFGIMDICGIPKDIFYYYKAWWTNEPLLYIFPHWNWEGKEGKEISVWCYGNCDEVELFLNDISFGRMIMPKYGHIEWKVPYVPGVIAAKGYKKGKYVLYVCRETTGKPDAVRLFPDKVVLKGNGEDVVVIKAAIVDAEGRVVPTADNRIDFDVSNNGVILGVGNGNPISHEPDKASSRCAFNGYACAIIKARIGEGTMVVRGFSGDLKAGMINLRVMPCKPRPSLAAVPFEVLKKS